VSWLYVLLGLVAVFCAAAMLALSLGRAASRADEPLERAIAEQQEREAVERRRRLSVAPAPPAADPNVGAPDDWHDDPRPGGAR